jgi:hypothetical protein
MSVAPETYGQFAPEEGVVANLEKTPRAELQIVS